MKCINTFILLFGFVSVLFTQKPAAEVVLTTGHNDQINSIAISNNERWMATGSNNNIVKIWDIPSSKEFTTLGPNDGRISAVKFSPDNKYIAALINHGSIKVWDFVQDRLILEVPADYNSNGIFFSEDNRWMFYINADGNATKVEYQKEGASPEVISEQYGLHINKIPGKPQITLMDHKGKLHLIGTEDGVQETYTLFDTFNFPFCPSKISASGKYFYSGFNDDNVHIFNLETGKKEWSVSFESKINGVHFDEENGLVYASLHGKKMSIYDLKKKKSTSLNNEEVFTPTHFEIFHENEILAAVHMKKIIFYNLKNKNIIKKFEPLISKMYNMTIDPNGEYMVAASGKINLAVWNLKQNKIDRLLGGFFPCQFGTDGKLYSMDNTMHVAVWDVKEGKIIKRMNAGYEVLQTMTVSPDGKYLAGAGFQGIIRIWNLEKLEIEKEIQAHTGGIYGLSFSPDSKSIASSGYDETVRIWDWKQEKELKVLEDQSVVISDVEFSPDGKYLASSSWDKTIYIRDTKTWDTIKVIQAHDNAINTLAFSDDSKYLASGATNNAVWKADNSVRLWEVPSGKKVCEFNGHLDGVNKVVFEPQTHRIFSCSNDGTIKLWNPDICNMEATFTAANDLDYVIFNKDYFYTGTKAALNGIAFKIKDRLYPFEQFDLVFNRPDLVAKTIGKTPENLIRAYEYIYQKRLKKMGFDKDDVKSNFVVPEIYIDRTNLPYITQDKILNFSITARDSVEKLERIQVYLNGVPFYGNSGIPLKNQNIHSVKKDMEIELISGLNRITVMSINTVGTYSLKESFEVIYEPKQLFKNDLYVIGIGVSEYENQDFNLTYPTKDVEDFVTQMKGNESIYKNIFVKKLKNEEVTLSAFDQLQKFISKADVDDVVMIFMAGHGVLDDEYNYYFGTYDMDFLKPTEKGLAYEKIEQLLTEIKAIKKLLIMDTCHSGEVDKDEIQKIEDPEAVEGDVEFRAVNAGYKLESAFGLENSREMVEALFSDIRQGSGATVISSAGGAEFAMESATWKNGLFTYCLLEGIKTGKADFNNDQKIEVDEIRKYVYENVKKLSNGKQQPTTRIENIQMNYPIYFR